MSPQRDAALAPTAAPPEPATDPLLGRVIHGRFKILSLIARGGMGRVYRAEQAPLGRIVALKVLQPNYQGDNDPEFHKRFFQEASLVAKLTHPNTVTLYDYGQSDDVYFMAMEYLEGRTLHRLLRAEGALEPARALHILLQAARALREAHGHGVIHRDLKPANVYLVRHDDDPDFVKLLDFGLLKRTDEDPEEALTQTGLFMGSPKYMAPEQIRGERVSAATDVYALGVMLFEMLTGRVPFDKANSVNLLMAHVTEEVPTLASINPTVEIPPGVEALVYRCLAKDPAERFATMDDLIAAIRTLGHALGRPLPGFTGEFLQSGPVAVAEVVPSRPPPLPSLTPRGVSSATPSASAVDPAAVSAPTAPPTTLGTVTPAARRSASSTALAAAAVLALCLVAVLALRPRATTPAPAPAALPPAPAAEPAPTVPTVQVALDSDPPGAALFIDGEAAGQTPFRAVWTGPRADPARAHRVVFRAPGYTDAEVTLQGATLSYRATLQPVAAPAAPTADPPADPTATPTRPPVARPARPARPVRPPRSTTAPDGYRDSPY